MKPLLLRLSVIAVCAGGLIPSVSAQPIGADMAFEGEILTRGPVHEAFAAVVSYNPEAGFIVDRPPPEPIEEMPPEERPVDADTAWIPGYWAWDDDRRDYIWISGTWRVLPPGRAWISGYWRDTGRGWQWVTGYWEEASRREVVYLSPPPETMERGPSTPQPTPNHEWVSGHWEWMDGRYLWRPGYWIEGRIDWVWVPSYYVWTPRGHVFVEGYWDYAPAERGLLFAPVYYAESRRPRSYYRPSIVLNVAILSDYLFLRPRYSHYYFGDYYDPRYESAGFYATFSYHSSRRGYDPFYAYSRWRHRDDRDWDRRYRESYEYRRSHVDARPPRTWSGTSMTVNVNQTIVNQNITQVGGADSRQTVTFAQPIQQYARSSDTPIRVERSAAVSSEQQMQVVRQVREARTQRRQIESQQVATSSTGQSASGSRQIGAPTQESSVVSQQSAAVALPTSPIVAREGSSGRQPPPRAQESRREGGRQARQAERSGKPDAIGTQLGQQTAPRRDAPEPRTQPGTEQQSVIGATPRNEPARRPDRGLRADSSAGVEAQRLEEQARQQEQQQAENARRSSRDYQNQIGAQPRQPLPESSSPRVIEQPGQGRERADERRAIGSQEPFAPQSPPQAERGREDQQRREQERQAQQQARQQESDARQAQREAEFQAREQQGRAAEQVRQQQTQAAEQARSQQAQAAEQRAQQSQAIEQSRRQQEAEQQRAQQSQAAEQARGQQRAAEQQGREQSRAAEQSARDQQARDQQRAAEQQSREQQRAAEQQGREQSRAAEQQAREQQSRAAEQSTREQQMKQAQPPPRVEQKASPGRGQDQPPPKKSKEEEEEERKKGKRG